MPPTLTRLARIFRHPAAGWLACAGVVVAIAAWVGGGTRSAAPAGTLARQTVAVPMQATDVPAGAEVRQLVVTVRWGHPSGHATAKGNAAWDGYLALDCGDIGRVDPQAWESDAGDHVGPVVRGEAGDQRVYWRSTTAADWDGLKLRVQTCPTDTDGSRSNLRIVTPARTYVARLAWSLDDFVSLPTGLDGSSLDIHIAADTELQPIRRDRVSQAAPMLPLQPLAAIPSAGVDADSVR